MTKAKSNGILKNLSIDILMLVIFALLLGLALWIVWMYFFRGPVDIETRGYVYRTVSESAVQPSETEKYTVQHFHNLDNAVLKGIEYSSTCVNCHGDYPHNNTPKVRAFFNAHSWFMACEVCHRENKSQGKITYKWLDNDSDMILGKLQGEPGMYGARIVPFIMGDKRLDNLIDTDTVSAYELSRDGLNEVEDKTAIEKMHQVLSKKPVSCEKCHTENSLFEFKDMLYSNNMAAYLKSLDVGSMVNSYKIFHLPNVHGTAQNK
ncbi:hypothetical protein MNBD_GAMMA25-384 [hydrothermal vent metagenome]|uniref:Uncharacterized protein n=1 Tax=hydrothermal vent metagenome TaxID=652676 RepID=A0A3B1BMK7_9ZZZZ